MRQKLNVRTVAAIVMIKRKDLWGTFKIERNSTERIFGSLVHPVSVFKENSLAFLHCIFVHQIISVVGVIQALLNKKR